MQVENAFVNFTSCDSRDTIVTRKLCQLYPAPLLITDTISKKYTRTRYTPFIENYYSYYFQNVNIP